MCDNVLYYIFVYVLNTPEMDFLRKKFLLKKVFKNKKKRKEEMLLRRNTACALLPPMHVLKEFNAQKRDDMITAILSALSSVSSLVNQEKTAKMVASTPTALKSKYLEVTSKFNEKFGDVPHVSEFIFKQFEKRPFTHFIIPTSNFGCSLLGFLSSKFNTSPLLDVNKIVNPNHFLRLKYSNTCTEMISSQNRINLISIASNFKQNNFSPVEIEPIPLNEINNKNTNKTNYSLFCESYQPKIETQTNTSKQKESIYVSEKTSTFPRMICVGRGAINAIKDITILASLLNAKLCFSRPAAEYFEKTNSQIGQTGISVFPKLYFTFGVSGAIQHLNGVKGNPKIVSINQNLSKTKSFADFAVQEDATKSAKEMIEDLKK